MRHLVIGGGPAGTAAAAAIRVQDPTAAVTLVAAEPHPLYSRIRLIEYLAGTIPSDALVIRRPDWYRTQGIRLVTGAPVEGIEAGRRSVTLHDGRTLAWDRLLLATGSRALRPPVPGIDLPGVFTLRTLDDADAIIAAIPGTRDAVVMGGGLLGLEVAAALRRRNLEVTVAEVAPRLLPRQLDDAGAAVLRARLERMGLSFVLGARVRQVTAEAGKAAGLELEDGAKLPAGLVLVSAGVRPETSLALDVGLDVPEGIPVDDRMVTPFPGIWAAGDCAQHRGHSWGLWPVAESQGRVAGTNMADGEAVYETAIPAATLKVAGVELYSAGEIDAEGRFESRVLQDPAAGIYRKLVLREGSLVGCILCGDLTGRERIAASLGKNAPSEDGLQALLRGRQQTGEAP